jgi:hypothetical protein
MAVGVLALSLVPALASAQNLVQDPGFESADTGMGFLTYDAPSFIGDGIWQVTQNEVAVLNNSDDFHLQAHSGNQFVVLTAGGKINTLSQTLQTTPGAFYSLSFFAAADNTVNTFSVSFGGVTVPGIPTSLPNTSTMGNITASDYVEYTATGLQASSANTVLSFTAANTFIGNDLLDDVEVKAVAVPAPSALLTALMGAVPGLTGVGFMRRKRAR